MEQLTGAAPGNAPTYGGLYALLLRALQNSKTWFAFGRYRFRGRLIGRPVIACRGILARRPVPISEQSPAEAAQCSNNRQAGVTFVTVPALEPSWTVAGDVPAEGFGSALCLWLFDCAAHRFTEPA